MIRRKHKMNKKNKKFLDFYKAPFYTNQTYGDYIFDKDGRPILNINMYGSDDLNMIVKYTNMFVDIINGESMSTTIDVNEITMPLRAENDLIFDKKDLCIGYARGWGYLTGKKNLSPVMVADLQNEFIEKLVKDINEIYGV